MKIYPDPVITTPADPNAAVKKGGRPRTRKRTCPECGTEFMGGKGTNRVGPCSTKCKDVWNNRRKARGSQLYDLLMTQRFDRARATEDGVWAAMCRLASSWYEEDGKRQTWSDIQRLFETMPYIKPVADLNIVKGVLARPPKS